MNVIFILIRLRFLDYQHLSISTYASLLRVNSFQVVYHYRKISHSKLLGFWEASYIFIHKTYKLTISSNFTIFRNDKKMKGQRHVWIGEKTGIQYIFFIVFSNCFYFVQFLWPHFFFHFLLVNLLVVIFVVVKIMSPKNGISDRMLLRKKACLFSFIRCYFLHYIHPSIKK